MSDVFVFYNCPEELMDFAVKTLRDETECYDEPVAIMTAECNEDWRLLEFYYTTEAFNSHVYIVTPCASVPDYIQVFAMTKDVAPQQQNETDVNMSLSTV